MTVLCDPVTEEILAGVARQVFERQHRHPIGDRQDGPEQRGWRHRPLWTRRRAAAISRSAPECTAQATSPAMANPGTPAAAVYGNLLLLRRGDAPGGHTA